MKNWYQIIALTGLLFLSGCSEDVNSDEVETEVIWAGIFVEAENDDATKVTVELNRRTFDGDNLILVAGDQLTATLRGVTNVLREENEIFDVDYETRFNFNASDDLMRISLSRPSTGASAPNSTVRMPTAFNLIQPFSSNSYDSNDMVVTNWSNTRNGAEVRLSYTLFCTSVTNTNLRNSESITRPDDGFYEFDLSTHSMFASTELDASQGCALRVTVSRVINGTLDPAYRSGRIRATQSRSIEGLPVTIVN